MIKRRSLLLGLAALVAVPSPAIVRAASLMPISPVPAREFAGWEKIIKQWRIIVRFSDDRGLEWISADPRWESAGWRPVADHQGPYAPTV
jgi:hypothetical protein